MHFIIGNYRHQTYFATLEDKRVTPVLIVTGCALNPKETNGASKELSD